MVYWALLASHVPLREIAALRSLGSGTSNLQPWQLINLLGAPPAAVVVVSLLVRDVGSWFRGRAAERARDRELR